MSQDEERGMKSPRTYFQLLEMMSRGSSYFGGGGDIFRDLGDDNKPKNNYINLKNGYELRPIEFKDEKVNSDLKYSHLYKDGEQISKEIFRKGGISNGYKDGYCQLIHYVRDKKRQSGFSYGYHVIVNDLGEIVLSNSGLASDSPRYDGGNLAHMKDKFYNLKTGEAFMVRSSSNVISGKNSVIVNHSYDWYGKDLEIPIGIYKIDKVTCEVTKIDEIDR